MSIKFDNNIINQIQQATDIVDVISEHLSLERKGKEWVGLCPFHSDHRPSMYVTPQKQIFKCFACGAGGDVIKFIQLRENLSFAQAIERLAHRAGIKLQPIQNRYRAPGSPDQTEEIDPRRLARVNEWATKLWREALFDPEKGKDVRDYLHQRQINDESIALWQLGLAVDSWDDLLKKAAVDKVPEKLLLACGLVVARENGGHYDKFRNRLMFPILDVTGRVIGFGGRTLGDDPAKYMNSPATALFDKSNSLYGMNKARHAIVSSGTAVVVEGYTDVIMAHQFGCDNVVATLGTSFTPGHARTLRRYAKRIVLVFDSDVAGAEAANRALEVCLSQHVDIKIGFVPPGQDPCDFLTNSGTKAFEKVIEDATDVMEFTWKRLTEKLETSDNLTDKKNVTEDFLRTIASAIKSGVVDNIARGLITTKLSRIIGLSPGQINSEISRLSRNRSGIATISTPNQRVLNVDMGAGFLSKAQREILEVLLNEPKLFETVKAKVTLEYFDVPVLKEIAGVLFECLEKNTEFQIGRLLGQIESVQTGAAIVELQQLGAQKANYAARLADAVDVILENAEVRQNIGIKEKISETETLRKLTKIAGRKNLRNPGMIPI